MVDAADLLNIQANESAGALSRAPESHLSSGQIAQPFEDMARALKGVGSNLEAGSQALEQGAVTAAERQAYADLGKQRVTRDQNGNVQVLDPANSVFWGAAGRHYENIVRQGTAVQMGQQLNAGMVDIASRNMLNPAGFNAGADALLDKFGQQFGGTPAGGEALMRGRERQVEHSDYITNRAALNDIEIHKKNLVASITADNQTLLGLAGTPGAEQSPEFKTTLARRDASYDQLGSDPLFKTPKNVIDLEKRTFDTRIAGERVVATIPKLIDEQGLPAARKAIDDFEARGDLEPGARRQIAVQARAELAQATPKWNEENRGFDATIAGIKKGLASGTLSLDDPNIQQAVTLGRARGYEREPELEALVANAPWMKRMGPLTPAQRNEAAGVPAPAPVIQKSPSGGAAVTVNETTGQTYSSGGLPVDKAALSTSAGSVPVNAEGRETQAGGLARYIYSGLLQRGFSAPQAAALLGNMQQESALRSGIENPGEGAMGLIQWRQDRRVALNAFAAARGKSPSDVDTQLDFIKHEMGTSEEGTSREFRSATTVQDANRALVQYIRYGDKSMGARLANAEAIAGGKFPAQGAPSRVAVASGSRWTDAQVRANPWLLADVFQGAGGSDPTEKLGYFEALTKSATQSMKFGDLPDQGLWSNIESIYGDHKGDARFEDKYEDAKGYLDAALAERLPPAQQAAWVGGAQAAAAGQGDPWVKARATAALEHFNALDKNWQDHPLAMGAATGIAPRPGPLNASDPQAVGTAMEQRGNMAAAVMARRGEPVSALEGEDLGLARSIFSFGTPDQKLAILGGMRNFSPPILNATLAKLGKMEGQGGYAIAGGLMAANQPDAAKAILAGKELLAKDPKLAPSGADLDKLMDDALPAKDFTAGDSRNAIADAARAVYATLNGASGKGGDEAARFKTALDRVTGGVLDYRGGKVIAPWYGASADDLDRTVKSVSDADLANAQAGDGSKLSAAQFTGAGGSIFSRLNPFAPNLQLESVGANGGGYFIRSGGAYLKDARTGAPFVLDLSSKQSGSPANARWW